MAKRPDTNKPVSILTFEGAELLLQGGGEYNIRVVDVQNEGGVTTQELYITKATGLPVDMLQARVDATNSCEGLYYFFSGTEIPYFDRLNTNNVTSMGSMFNFCSNLINLDLSHLNTSNVTYMYAMFGQCSSLTELNLSNFKTNNVTEMGYMFSGCQNLMALDLSGFDFTNVRGVSGMFYNCSNLRELDLSSFVFTNITQYSNMFTGVPTDCLIYVKDQTAYDWITSKFTMLTNVQIKGA